MNDIEKAIEDFKAIKASFPRAHAEAEKTMDLAISALEKQSDKNCSRCVNKNQCAIHDNFNIDYCSDWSVEE